MPRFYQLPACTFLVLAMAGTHHATEPPSLEKVLSFPTRGESPASILSTGFDTPEERAAKRPPGFQVVPGQGRNGTACLFYQRTDPDAYPLCSVPLPGTADGPSHQLKLWIRTEAIEVHGSDHNIGAVCVEYGRDGKWSGGAYFKLDQPSPEWRQITLPFTPPKGVRASLQFYLRRGITGRIWFDDVEIRDAGITHEVLITRPDRHTFFGDQRQVRFRVSGQVPRSALLLVTTKNAGRTQDLLLSGDGGIYHASLAPLEPGPVEITARIADAEAGEFIGSGSFQLQARPPATPPANACLIDPHGRAVVDGKPFMPLGVYGFADESNYRRLAADGFNCIQLYGSLSLRGREKTADPYRDLLAGMDLIDGAGLKLIVRGIHQQENHRLPGQHSDRPAAEPATRRRWIGLPRRLHSVMAAHSITAAAD